jgi:hypothetical protein
MIDHIELKRLAEAATQGQWSRDTRKFGGVVYGGPIQHWVNGSGQSQVAMTTGADWMRPGETEANADFIAAANPAAILDLLAEIERLKGGQGEPVAWLLIPSGGRLGKKHVHLASEINSAEMAEIAGRYFDVRPLYTSQPEPVSVVLPEREEGEPYWSGELDADFDQLLEWAEAKGFNRAIDKVKELNG